MRGRCTISWTWTTGRFPIWKRSRIPPSISSRRSISVRSEKHWTIRWAREIPKMRIWIQVWISMAPAIRGKDWKVNRHSRRQPKAIRGRSNSNRTLSYSPSNSSSFSSYSNSYTREKEARAIAPAAAKVTAGDCWSRDSGKVIKIKWFGALCRVKLNRPF